VAGKSWQFEGVPCDYCGSTDADLLLTGRDWLHGLPGEFRVVACRRCGLARTSPRPTLESLPTAYPEDYVAFGAPCIGVLAPRGLLRWALVNYRGYPLGRPWPALLRMLAAPLGGLFFRHRQRIGYFHWAGEGRLLDFGCGTGKYLAAMAAAGWKAEGLDLSPDAVRICREAGLTAHQGTLPGAHLPPQSYDVITLWHALEHVPSPRATLEAVRPLLRPGGRLIIDCPRFDSRSARRYGTYWYALDVPRHLTHFTREHLARHLASCGYTVKRFLSVRRPTFIRQSLLRRAEATGRRTHRFQAEWRFWPRLLSHRDVLLGNTDEMICIAQVAP
jgi:2-polyprenyl-3-methyl-5-hydroxy-6-metoxy-1,4-benzoquinol methylase